MIEISDKQETIAYAALKLLIMNLPARMAVQVLADVLAEAIHDSAPGPIDSDIAADEIHHRMKQRLQALRLEG